MAAAWRLYFAESAGGVYIDLVEVAFLDNSGADLSVGGTASASSQYGAGYEVERAFDKSTATEWSTDHGAPFPAWIQYTHATPVDVAKVRLVFPGNDAWLPTAGSLSLRSGAALENSYFLTLASGSISPGATAVFAVHAISGLSLAALPAIAAVQGNPAHIYNQAASLPAMARALRDFRVLGDSDGTWTDRVIFKAGASAPEQPFAGALVWVLRRADAALAWSGFSDASGYYTATGLERGVDYVAVGIDPRDAARIPPDAPGLFKTVGAGPFTVPLA